VFLEQKIDKIESMAQVEDRDEIRKLRETEARWTESPGGSPSGRARGLRIRGSSRRV